MSEHEISEILKNSVPGEPGMSGLGDKVRSGHRRRRVMQGAVAALGVVALGIPVAIQLGNNLDTQPPVLTTPSPTPTVAPTEPTETPTSTPTVEPSPSDPGTAVPPELMTTRLNSEVCEDAQGTVTDFPDALIPEGVTKLHLCSNDQEAAIPVFGAPEPILMDVSDLIADVNASHEVHDLGTCEAEDDGVVSYIVVLEYADGEKLVINTSTVDCLPVISDGDVTGRGDGAAFFDAVLTRLQEQRQTLDYRHVGDENLCLEAESIVSRSIYDVVSGAACGVEPSSEVPYEGIIANPLPDELLARIVGEATATADQAPAHGLPLFSRTLVLQTLHGDPMTLYRWDDGSFYYREGSTWMAWTPSEELATELATYFVGMRTEMFPEDFDVDLCMDPNLLLNEEPLGAATGADLCRQGSEQGIYDTVTMPGEVFDGLASEVEAAAETVDRYTAFTFTNHWIAMVAPDGTVRQLFIAEGGVLVWDDVADFDIRHTAPAPEALLTWLGQVGLDV